MRLLYLPNESKPGDQIGPRTAFEAMSRDGTLSAYEVFSYLVEAEAAGARSAMQNLLKVAGQFGADVIFWQHVHQFPVPADIPGRLKALPSRPKLVYHEGDPYDRVIKRIPPPARRMMAAADLCILIGLGDLGRMVRECGARNVVYAPHSYDTRRFGKPWTPDTRPRRFDALMIGNRIRRPRIAPMLYLPGGRRRDRLAREMSAAFGSRFGVYGLNWPAQVRALGPLPFDEQESAIRSAWMTVNWDHFDDIPYYFSDRLPFSLAAGVPHVTTHHEGYEHLFRGCDGLYFVRSVPEVVEVSRWLNSLPRARVNELGAGAAAFAREQLEATRVYRNVVQMIRERLFESSMTTGTLPS